MIWFGNRLKITPGLNAYGKIICLYYINIFCCQFIFERLSSLLTTMVAFGIFKHIRYPLRRKICIYWHICSACF